MDISKNKTERRSVRSVKVAPHHGSMEPPENKCSNMCSFPAVLFYVITLCLAVLTFSLLCGGLASEYWVKDTGLNLGLFRGCSSGQCGSARSVATGVDYLDAVAGLEIVGLLLFLASLLLLCLHIVTDACYSVDMALSLGLLSAGVLLAFAAGIFICAGCMHLLYSMPGSSSLGASWWLAACAGVVTLFYWMPLFMNFILSPSDAEDKQKGGIEETAADKAATRKEKKTKTKVESLGSSNGQAYTVSKSPTMQSCSAITTASTVTSSNVMVEGADGTTSRGGNNVASALPAPHEKVGENIISVVPVGEDGAAFASSRSDTNKAAEDSETDKGTKKKGGKKGLKTPRTQEPLPPLHVPNVGPVTEQMQVNAMRRIESDPQMSSREKKRKDKEKKKHRSRSKEEPASEKKRKDRDGDADRTDTDKKSARKSESKQKAGGPEEATDKAEKAEKRSRKEKAEGGDKKEKGGDKKEKGGDKKEKRGEKKEKGRDKRDKSSEKSSKKEKEEGSSKKEKSEEKRERSPEKSSRKEKKAEEDDKKERKKKHASKSKENSSDADKGEKKKKSKEKDGSKKKHKKE